jgi:5'-deoxynucleotidase YfbR-like HD superfamily hydrolase
MTNKSGRFLPSTDKDEQWISLLSGAKFNYNKPEESDVTIEDIASALSNVCRFSGHLPRFYSVAQHLVNTSRIVSPPNRFTALMHDTAEAFTNDLPTPLKWALPIFKELEVSIESAMGKKFGFEYPYPQEVKDADTTMLMLEKYYVKGDDSVWPNYEKYDKFYVEPYRHLVEIEHSWQPVRAKREFLERFYELQEKKPDSEGFGGHVLPAEGARREQKTPARRAA